MYAEINKQSSIYILVIYPLRHNLREIDSTKSSVFGEFIFKSVQLRKYIFIFVSDNNYKQSIHFLDDELTRKHGGILR